MGKRSPILGYNHNVRYRGLVFHVQTEDSGVASPHLFTHLFHGGVIVSTRKLVYDAGSAEESIKSLMQAQHKATLKDLRRGHFDDKIDSYLGGTPGLLPRGTVEAEVVASEVEPALSAGTIEDVAVGAPTEQVMPLLIDELSAPVMIMEKTPPPRPLIPPPPLPRAATQRSLPVQTPAMGRGTPAQVDTTLRTAAPVFDPEQDATQAVDAPVIELIERSAELDDAADAPPDEAQESEAPEIEIQLELDDNDEAVSRTSTAMGGSRRNTRDTELQQPFLDNNRPTLEVRLDDHTRPTLGMVNEEARRAASLSDGIPGAIRASSPAIPPPPPDSRKLGDRPSTINASALPPARPISRPAQRPALSQPQVMSRPVTATDDRPRRESEAVEVYSPAPASAELPGERPGQYAQHKKVSSRIPIEGLKNERSGGVAIPAGLGRPHRSATAAPVGPRPATAPPATTPVPMEASVSAAVSAAASAGSTAGRGPHTEPLRSRAPTPSRVAPPGAVASARPSTPASNSGVVMTRPAVIVGAPAKSVATVPRIRKAREEEGRGFGQGLISEKSLDEVILAYLSEDADDK